MKHRQLVTDSPFKPFAQVQRKPPFRISTVSLQHTFCSVWSKNSTIGLHFLVRHIFLLAWGQFINIHSIPLLTAQSIYVMGAWALIHFVWQTITAYSCLNIVGDFLPRAFWLPWCWGCSTLTLYKSDQSLLFIFFLSISKHTKKCYVQVSYC